MKDTVACENPCRAVEPSTEGTSGNERASCLVAGGLWLGLAAAQSPASGAEDRFQLAIDYVFTGRLDATNGPEITDRRSCIVLVPEPKFNRYARYYLSRFKMDTARISKKYAGAQTLYELEVEGDDVVLEYLKADKTTVDYGFRSRTSPCPASQTRPRRRSRLFSRNIAKRRSRALRSEMLARCYPASDAANTSSEW